MEQRLYVYWACIAVNGKFRDLYIKAPQPITTIRNCDNLMSICKGFALEQKICEEKDQVTLVNFIFLPDDHGIEKKPEKPLLGPSGTVLNFNKGV